LALGMNTYARDFYEKAIQIDNANSDIYLKYAQALYELQDYETVVTVLDKSIELSKDDATPYYNKSLALYQLEKYDLALDNINNAINCNCDVADYFFLKGMILEKLGNMTEAIYAYEECASFSEDESAKEQIKQKVKTLNNVPEEISQ